VPETGLRIFRKEKVMTNRITITAADVQVGDLIYDGPGANVHPTFAWETVTQVHRVDGLVMLTAGRLDSANGEFWFDPAESVTVIRHPPEKAEEVVTKPRHKRGHSG
jgi:hypothetical protein